MQHLDERTIHAWLDGELSPAERAEVEAHIATCAECAAAVAEARGFIAASSRILTALDSVPGGVLPAASTGSSASRRAVHRRFVASRAWMAAAAVLVLSTVSVIAIRTGDDPEQFVVGAAKQHDSAPAASAVPFEEQAREMKPSGRQQPAAAPAVAQAGGNAVSTKAPTTMQSRAAAPADASKPVDQTERLRSRLEAERKSTLVRPNSGEPGASANAAPRPRMVEPPAPTNRVADQPSTPPTDSVAEKDLADKRETAVPVNGSTSELRAGASARGVTITGRVTSDAGAPLASASVALEGTNIAAITGADGSYALDVPAARASGQTTSLVARLIGYKAVAVPIALSDAPIAHDFVLTPNPLALGEVVVTGEGVASASDKLGAVAGTNESPVVVSRSRSTESGDTVATTIYAVRDGTVTLIEHSSARDALRRQKRSADFSDQVMAKARDDVRPISITLVRFVRPHTHAARRSLRATLSSASHCARRDAVAGSASSSASLSLSSSLRRARSTVPPAASAPSTMKR